MTNLEIIISAQINFNNVEKDNPQLKQNPIYRLAKIQLDEFIENIEKDKMDLGNINHE